jgi:CBS domain-containing protein
MKVSVAGLVAWRSYLDVLSVTEDIEAVDIARVMLETGVKSVPVVRDGRSWAS